MRGLTAIISTTPTRPTHAGRTDATRQSRATVKRRSLQRTSVPKMPRQ
ncbi:MAG: hypothetical protein K6T33_11000 [Thermomonas hydrothermalis]|nr:hypothetical protein [Thermomonas hydrothermalis]MCL6620299.1 hypothetical protein [Thermomonas hydrothermalis]